MIFDAFSPSVLATLAFRLSPLVAVSSSVFTTIWRVPPEPTSCGVDAGVVPASVNAVFTWSVVMDVFATGSWNWVPPANSTP